MKRPALQRSLDPLDDLPEASPALIRFCGRPGCRQPCRPRGRYCAEHYRKATRRWRETNRQIINARRRDQAGDRPAEQRTKDSARAKLAMAVRRGKIAKGRCQECGERDVTGYQPDSSRPLDVVWLCRSCRREGVDRLEREQRLAAQRASWEVRRAAAEATYASLPEEARRTVEARALDLLPANPVVRRRGTPLYHQALVRAIEEQAARRRPE